MIRNFHSSDMDAIVHVRTHVAENHLSVERMAEIGITPQSIEADIAVGYLGCWVAENQGRVVAFAMADKRDAKIFALFVLPEQEGKGYGSALISTCEAWLLSNGIKQAKLSTGRGTRAYAFYLKRGWSPTGEISGHFEDDDVLRKTLSL